MDKSERNEQAGTTKGSLEIIRRLEQHYACGCSTTRIECLRSQSADLQPGCQGHGGRLVRSVEMMEYREKV